MVRGFTEMTNGKSNSVYSYVFLVPNASFWLRNVAKIALYMYPIKATNRKLFFIHK